MQPKSASEVSDRVKGFYTRAKDAARQSNVEYAIEMFQTALKHCPEFREARNDLRKVEMDKIKHKVSGTRQAWIATKNTLNLSMKAPGFTKKGEYNEAFQIIESVLAKDPTVPSALKLLASTAVEAEMEWLAIDTLEFFIKFNTKDIVTMQELVQLYLDNGRADDAVELCQRMKKIEPGNGALQSLFKSAIARQAMDNSWMGDEAAETEAEEKKPGTSTTVPQLQTPEEQVEQLIAQINNGEDSVGVRKKLARNLIKVERYDDAIETLQAALTMSERVDPSLQNMIYSAVEGRFDNAIRAWDTYAQQGDAQAEQAEPEIAALSKQKSDFMLQKARERAAMYSKDANVHMELAMLLWEREDYDEALTEFSQAQGGSRHRKQATLHKGRCFNLKEDYESATKEYKLLLSELDETSELRLPAIFELAEIQKKSGEDAESEKNYKLVHEADPSYKNIEEIINNL